MSKKRFIGGTDPEEAKKIEELEKELEAEVEKIDAAPVPSFEPAAEEPKEPAKPVEVPAVVDGVKMYLNVRKKPEVVANNQVGILAKGTKIMVINPNKEYSGSGESWFKIKFGKPVQEGYAMKKYIRIL